MCSSDLGGIQAAAGGTGLEGERASLWQRLAHADRRQGGLAAVSSQHVVAETLLLRSRKNRSHRWQCGACGRWQGGRDQPADLVQGARATQFWPSGCELRDDDLEDQENEMRFQW